MLAGSRDVMTRVVHEILGTERFQEDLRDFVSLFTRPDPEPPAEREVDDDPDPYDRTWMPRFCELVAETGNALLASARLREEIPDSPARSTIYVRRERCPRFAREWGEALSRHDARGRSE